MTKKNKIIIGVISACVAVILIASLIIGLVINNKRTKTPTSVMTCSVNPQVQFVLNAKNEVMQVVALNNDGKAITMRVEFVGLDAEDAAEKFVKISTELGYINPETEGTEVKIDLNGSKKNYNKLKDKITKKVNKYFDENGIIAGAITTITEDFKEAIKTLKPNALNLDDKSQKELMEHYLNITELIEGIEPNHLTSFYNVYNQAVQTKDEALAKIEKDIADYTALLETLKTQLAELTEESPLFKQISDKIAETNLIIKNANDLGFKAITDEFNATLSRHLGPEKQGYQSFLNNLETEINARIQQFASKLSEHKTYFESHKSEVEGKIAAYRATLNA